MHLNQVRHIVGVRHLLKTAQREAMSLEACLAGSQVNPVQLESLDFRIQTWQEIQVISNIVKAIGRPGLGFDTGSRYRLTTLGPLGFLMAASPTLSDAFSISERYHSFSLLLCRRHGEQDAQGNVRYVYDASQLPPAIRRFVVEREIAARLRVAADVLQREVLPLAVEMMAPPPPDMADFQRLFPCPVIFNAPCNAIVFAADDIGAPLPWANADAAARGEKICQEIFFDLSLPLVNTPLAAQVQSVLMHEPAARVGIQGVAEHLGLSERSLQRRLKEEGHRFQQLSDSIKLHLAERLLQDERLDLENIACQLGYSDETTFIRAFRRWTGMSPRSWAEGARANGKQRSAPPAESDALSGENVSVASEGKARMDAGSRVLLPLLGSSLLCALPLADMLT